MIVNSLKIPISFVEMIRKGTLRRKIGGWNLRQEIDAFGNHFESELSQIFENKEEIVRETNLLSNNFESDDFYGEEGSESKNSPGFIPDIIDFSKIICFGISGDGAPFCFDYRDNSEEPNVIWWDDVYWRRIAPDFISFIELFDLGDTK